MEYWAGKNSPELLEYLLKRRSLKVAEFADGGPNEEELNTILTAAARVPDHGKTCPFYFVVFQGDARKNASDVVARIYKDQNPDAPAEMIEKEEQRFLRSHTVIGVIYRARQAKHPLWEQMMSAGAACQNLVLAANASGFAAQWLSEWYAYDEQARQALGLDGRDVVAGFIHIGKPATEPEERERPDLSEIVTHWEEGMPLKKGDLYNREKFEIPRVGFEIYG